MMVGIVRLRLDGGGWMMMPVSLLLLVWGVWGRGLSFGRGLLRDISVFVLFVLLTCCSYCIELQRLKVCKSVDGRDVKTGRLKT